MKSNSIPFVVEVICVAALAGTIDAGGLLGYDRWIGHQVFPLATYLPGFLSGAICGAVLLPLFRWIHRPRN